MTLAEKTPDMLQKSLDSPVNLNAALARIADHTTIIAEDVIYMIEGVITRNSGDSERNDAQ